MKIKRFDSIEFDVLRCGERGGYYPLETEQGQRALLLMREGVYNDNPPGMWWKDGYKGFTKKGEGYYKTFMEKVRATHGHVWETNNETSPDIYDDDEYGKRINSFAYSEGYHNGPRCKNCGYSFCEHCMNEMEIPACSAKAEPQS